MSIGFAGSEDLAQIKEIYHACFPEDPDAFDLHDAQALTSPADVLEFDKVTLLYYNQCSNGCDILQPVFVLDGYAKNGQEKVKLTFRVIAIAQRFTFESIPTGE